MKNTIKRIVCILTAVCILSVSLFAGVSVTVKAYNDFALSGCFLTEYAYLYDETGLVSYEEMQSLFGTLQAYNRATSYKIGMYIGAKTRTKADGAQLAADGLEYLESYEYASPGTVFIYLDESENEGQSDYIYCSGESLHYYHVGENGTVDICRKILDNVRGYSYENDSSVSKHIRDVAGFTAAQLQMQYYYPSETGEELSTAEEDSFFEEESYNEISDYEQESITPYEESYPDYETSYNIPDNPLEKTYKEYMGETTLFIDEGGLFGDEQAKQVVDMMRKTSNDIKFNLVINAGTVSRSDREIETMAKSGALTIFGTDIYNGTVYLYIDLDGYKNAYDYMFCSQDSFLYFTNGDDGSEPRIDDILYKMEDYFPAGGETIIIPEIVKGLQAYCNALEYYKEKGLVSDIYYTDAYTGEYVYASFGKIVRSNHKPYLYWWVGMIIGIAVGIVVIIVICEVVKKRYKFRTPASASLYTSRRNMIMRDSQDVFIGSHVSKVRIQSSSGGHGGGHGGGHHGGGGGGHHR